MDADTVKKSNRRRKPVDLDRSLVLWKQDVAILMNLSPKTLDRMVYDKEMPPYDIILKNRRRGWKKGTIIAWIDANCPSTKEHS